MKYFILFIFSVCIAITAAGQDSTRARPGSGPEIWIDYGKLAFYMTDFESKLEGGVTWRIGRVAPTFLAGISELNPEQAIKNGEYTVEGTYWRAGLEYYIALDRSGKNRLIVGGRYGSSSFSERGSFVISSNLWPDETGFFERNDLTATWAEVVTGSEMTLGTSRFVMGGYFTLRVLIDREKFEPIDTYAIPGYGRTVDKTVPALQLYLKFSLAR